MFTSPKAIHTDFSFKMCGLERKVITISIQIETEIFQFVLKPAKGKEFSTNTLTNKVLPFRRAEEQSSGCPTFIGLVRVAQILRQDWGVPVLHHGVGGGTQPLTPYFTLTNLSPKPHTNSCFVMPSGEEPSMPSAK